MLFDSIEEDALDDELRVVAQESVDAQRLAAAPDGDQSALVGHGTTRTAVPRQLPTPERREAQPATPQAAPAAPPDAQRFTSFEICAGAGAQALGLERAGFDPVLLIDSKADACFTIDLNRAGWDVVCMDIVRFRPDMRPETFAVDLLSGGLPRVNSMATVARAEDTEERRVLRAAIALARDIKPKAVLLENVPDLVESPGFDADRSWIEAELREEGFRSAWKVLNAADFGVPQNRRSGFLVALQEPYFSRFSWPEPDKLPPPTVGQVLGPSMSANGWTGAERWIKSADRIAPALVGGSDRRGGADLGPTGSKRAWAALGVNGNSLGDAPPDIDFPADGHPKLTVDQAALIQAFPDNWRLFGGKTSRYRQVGHAMPPPLAAAVGQVIAVALRS
ncbi:DNA cytosine methyltransferase [Streptomyces chiangmaiensis]